MKFIVQHSPTLTGTIKVPGDKSISHRSIMLGSLANGTTKITGFLRGEDSLATMQAFKDMGVNIIDNGDEVMINGVGLYGLQQPKNPLNLGNAGTAVRLISGILAGQHFKTTLIGDASLSSRPMQRIITPLTQMGANIHSNNGKLPLVITGTTLQSIHYNMPMASAQVKSCILLAGLYATGTTSITQPEITRDHLERMLKGFGVAINNDANTISITPSALTATDIMVPGDISSAAFFIVAASIANNADITLKNVNINPTRTGVLEILKLMGANITLTNEQKISGELLADIRVKSAQLHGIKVPKHLVPLAIDEFPVLFIAMSQARGTSIVTGAAELKVKECDRIEVMSKGLTTLGIHNIPTDDGIIIEGGAFKAPLEVIESYHDHRISMAFAVASCACKHNLIIDEVDNVATSLPNFKELCQTININIQVAS